MFKNVVEEISEACFILHATTTAADYLKSPGDFWYATNLRFEAGQKLHPQSLSEYAVFVLPDIPDGATPVRSAPWWRAFGWSHPWKWG